MGGTECEGMYRQEAVITTSVECMLRLYMYHQDRDLARNCKFNLHI